MELFLTPNDVSMILKIKPEIVRRKVRNGELKGYKIGNLWRFKKSDIETFIENSACVQRVGDKKPRHDCNHVWA